MPLPHFTQVQMMNKSNKGRFSVGASGPKGQPGVVGISGGKSVLEGVNFDDLMIDIDFILSKDIELELVYKMYNSMIDSMDSMYAGKSANAKVMYNTLIKNKYLISVRNKNLNSLLE